MGEAQILKQASQPPPYFGPHYFCCGVLGGSCPLHCRMFSSLPALYPSDVCSTSHPGESDPKCLQTLPNVPWGSRSALVRTTGLQWEVIFPVRRTWMKGKIEADIDPQCWGKGKDWQRPWDMRSTCSFQGGASPTCSGWFFLHFFLKTSDPHN